MRQRAASLGVRTIPWVRLGHVNHGDTWEDVKTKLSLLVTTALFWGENIIIPNYEDEAHQFSPSSVADHLYGVLDWDGETGWSTLAWVPNTPDYSDLANRGDSALLQIFPTDNRWDKWQVAAKMGDCVAHARVDKGFRYVGVTYETYGAQVDPTWFDCESHMHSTFPGNVIAPGQWGSWYR